MPRVRRGESTKSTGNKVKVNFEGIEGRVLLPEGDYAAKVNSAEQVESSTGNPMLKWVFHTIDDDKRYHNKPLYVNTSLQPQALWNLRNLLEAMGEDIPDDEFDLDLESLVGKELVLTVGNEDYEGRKTSRVTDYSPMEDEPDKPDGKKIEKVLPSSGKRGKAAKPAPEVEKIDPADVRNMDEDQLTELIEEHELDVELSDFSTLRRKVNSVIDALEAKDLLGEE